MKSSILFKLKTPHMLNILFILFTIQTTFGATENHSEEINNHFNNWVKDNIHIYGYISQSWIKTTDNDIYAHSSASGGTFNFHESAINSYITLSNNLTLSSQLLYRTDGSPSKDLRWDYAYLDYNLELIEDNYLELKLGRVKNYLGFYNESLDTPWGRNSITPPLLYQNQYRSFFLSGDGFATSFSTDVNNWSIDLGYSNNKNITNETLDFYMFGIEMNGHFKSSDTETYKANISYFNDDYGQFTLQYSGGELLYDYDQGTGFIPSGLIQANVDILSFQWDINKFSYITEYHTQKIRINGFGGAATSIEGLKPLTYYHEIIYHASYKWDFSIRYENYYQNESDKDGSKIANLSNTVSPEDAYQKAIVLGVTWHYNDNFMLRVEAQYNKGYSAVPRWFDQQRGLSPTIEFISGLKNKELDKYWSAFMLQASYKFNL